MVIKFSRHITDKLVLELSKMGITEEFLEEVVNRPDEVLYDSVTRRYVALKMVRNLAVVYETSGRDIFIITAIHSSNLEDVVQKRKKSGRWL